MQRKLEQSPDEYDPNGEMDDQEWLNPARRSRGKRQKSSKRRDKMSDPFSAYHWAEDEWASNEWDLDSLPDWESEPWENDLVAGDSEDSRER